MSTAPDRDGERARAEQAKRPPVRDERPVRMTRPQGAARPAAAQPVKKHTSWTKAAVLVNSALIIIVAIVGIRYTQGRDDSEPDTAVEVPATAATPTASDEANEAGDEAGDEASQTPSETPSEATTPETPAAPTAPAVKTTLRSDFADGDGFPVGADPRDTASVGFPMAVLDGQLVHGDPAGPDAISWLQKWTDTDVRRIGAKIRFAPNHSGEAALTAWFDSVLEQTGTQVPTTGMRLVVTPGAWRLVAITRQGGAEQPLADGTFAVRGAVASFDLVRKDDRVWITDPAGAITVVRDKRIQRFSGPWATWELREDGKGTRPAAFREIWAG